MGYLTEVELYSISKIDSLLEKILLDSRLFQEIEGIKTWIMLSFYEIKRYLQKIEELSDKGEIINKLIPNELIKIRFHLRQLACYFICEAERLGYKELANVMKKVSEFEPDTTMQQIELFRKTGLPSKPNRSYACCSTKQLVEKAREKADNLNINQSLGGFRNI